MITSVVHLKDTSFLGSNISVEDFYTFVVHTNVFVDFTLYDLRNKFLNSLYSVYILDAIFVDSFYDYFLHHFIDYFDFTFTSGTVVVTSAEYCSNQ